MIVSGAPNRTSNHACEIIEMSIDMLSLSNTLRDPVTGKPIMIRIGNFQIYSRVFLNNLKACFTNHTIRLPYWISRGGGSWC